MKIREIKKITDKHYVLLLLGILLLGFAVRIVGIDWDMGHYLHPDERAIFLFSLPLSFPSDLFLLLSPESPLNPKFFAYGSLPLYFLKLMMYFFSFVKVELGGYGQGYLVGRTISVLLDTGIILLVYFLGKRIFTTSVGLLAAFFYAIAVFPIQNSHFYTADVFLSFFTLLSFLLLLNYKRGSRLFMLIMSAVALGFAIASKVSALPFLAIVGVALYWDFFQSLFLHRKTTIGKIMKYFLESSYFFVLFASISYLTFAVLMPYAIIDFSTFWQQLQEQQRMTESAFTFPYTLQYVGKVPYIYELKQVVLWGLGIPIGLLALFGTGYTFYLFVKNFSWKKSLPLFLALFFCILYFGIVGRFAVGWMRYMLPLYPLLVLFTAAFSLDLFGRMKQYKVVEENRKLKNFIVVAFLLTCSVWTISFLRTYFETHPRVTASEWIHENIPAGSTLALEHWDDALPLQGIEKYQTVTLPLYDHDSEWKWENVSMLLESTDYIILSSNRLYDPLTRLSEMCEDVPQQYCYKRTAAYYSELFSGESDFRKVAEFTSFPTLPIVGWEIDDQGADESFTVYDHPKVIIFEKNR